jgi:hypothetical protein
MRMALGRVAHARRQNRALTQPALGLCDQIGRFDIGGQHAQLDGRHGLTRQGAQPIGASGHMRSQLRQDGAPLRIRR